MHVEFEIVIESSRRSGVPPPAIDCTWLVPKHLHSSLPVDRGEYIPPTASMTMGACGMAASGRAGFMTQSWIDNERTADIGNPCPPCMRDCEPALFTDFRLVEPTLPFRSAAWGALLAWAAGLLVLRSAWAEGPLG